MRAMLAPAALASRQLLPLAPTEQSIGPALDPRRGDARHSARPNDLLGRPGTARMTRFHGRRRGPQVHTPIPLQPQNDPSGFIQARSFPTSTRANVLFSRPAPPTRLAANDFPGL